MEVSCQHHALAALSTGISQVPRRVPEALWMPWRKEKSLAPTGIRTLEHPTRNMVSILTMPSRLPAWINVYVSPALLRFLIFRKIIILLCLFFITTSKIVRATPLCLAGEKPHRVRPRNSSSKLKFSNSSSSVFLNRRAAARYRALASIVPCRDSFSWKLSF